MRIAITGASGHIGNCLVRELKKQGASIKVLVHSFRGDLEELDVDLIQGNLLEPESLNTLCSDAEVVFHLAAQIDIGNKSPAQIYDTNVTGTKNILKAAGNQRVKKFIHFSSIHAFETNPLDQMLDETRPKVEKEKIIYEYSKAEGEREVMKAVKEGLNAVILNPTAVIGPFDKRNSFLGQALIKIHQNKLPFIVSGGYNWVDVRDVVTASIEAIVSGRIGENYILSGKYCSLRDLAVMISEISGCRIPGIVPISLAQLACPFFKIYSSISNKEPLYTYQSLNILINSPVNISSEKAIKELGFNPRPLKQTLLETFDWYRQEKFIK